MRSDLLSLSAVQFLAVALLWLPANVPAQERKDSPEPAEPKSGARTNQAAAAQAKPDEEIARLKEENARLRKENQALRQLLAAQMGSTNTNAVTLTLPTVVATNRLSPELINSLTNWLTTSSGKRHNSRCRYFKTTIGKLCGPDEGQPCKLCGG